MKTNKYNKSKSIWLSPTSINAYINCPRKFYLRYVKKLRGKASIHLVKGIAVHEALSTFYQLVRCEKINYGFRKKMVHIFNDSWRKQMSMVRGMNLDNATLCFHYNDCLTMLDNWLDEFEEKTSGECHPPASEVKIFSNTLHVMGVIDAIFEANGKVILVDYKTSAKDTITNEIKVQMGIYALLFTERYGKKPDSVGVVFLKTGTKRLFPVDEALIASTKDIIEDIRLKTLSDKEEDYPCTCGGWCTGDFIEENETGPNQDNSFEA